MPVKAEVGVQGVNKLARALRDAGEEMQDSLKQAHLEGAEIVARYARPLVPVRSGALERTVRTSATLRSGRVRAGKKSVPYAGPVHFGWPKRNIRPQPFLYDALDRRRDEILDVFLERVEDLAAKVAAEASKGGGE